ncbi:ABC transporter substrate-binding protein [Williamsia sp.]|uniref:ABC transporter substrate-binding protein n=1 Tax=Williamsia sp. TaxID=1872085 RepID=UPI001A25B205|nr:ABC transporter substrate-binding protein [Williamsia sp.]MBJ7287838.1 ABC transporter substrate-binding protein [Williamsia sp.]
MDIPDLSRRRLLGGAAGLATLSVLGACTARSSERRTATGAPGGTLVLGSLSDIDPKALYSQSISTIAIGLLVFDTLIRYDRATLTPRPSVATGWEVSADGRTVRVDLRDDVYFHSGRRLTSADVAYVIERYAANSSASQLQAAAATITSVDTSMPFRVVLGLAYPLVNLFDLFEFMLLVDRESEEGLTAGTEFVGTGPFRFSAREVGVRLELVGNDRYWNGPPLLDGITFRVVRDSSALLTSVRVGQTDLVLDAAPGQLRRFSDRERFSVQSEDVYDVAYYVGVNVADPALSNKTLRQAISYAVDRDRIVDEVLEGRGSASSTPWSTSSPAYSEQASRRYSRDLDTARRLLAAAGGPPGRPVLLSYGTGLAIAPLIAGIIQNNLAQIGFRVQLDPREQASFSPFLSSGAHQLWINPHGFGQSSPATLATGAAPFKPAKNLSGFTSPEYASVVAGFDTLTDPRGPAAIDLYRRYTEILLDEQFVIDLAITTSTNVATAAMRGLNWNAYKYIDAHRVTIN